MASLGSVEVDGFTLLTYKALDINLRLPLNQILYAQQAMDGMRQAQLRGKKLLVEFHAVSRKRTLTQNAYKWALMSRIAEEIGSTPDEVYEQMLDRYGVHCYQSLPEGQSAALDLRCVRELGSRVVDGVKFISYAGVIGSSHYDTEQMAAMLDGIISECRDLDINTTVEGWEEDA